MHKKNLLKKKYGLEHFLSNPRPNLPKKYGLGFGKKCSISNHMYQRAKGWHHINDKLFNL